MDISFYLSGLYGDYKKLLNCFPELAAQFYIFTSNM